MEKKKITKLFFAWQDENEQTWLEQMAAHGWILEEVGFIRYTFRKEKPRHINYRLDYQELKESELQSYLELFADAGWEYIGRLNNWFYFASSGPDTREIYTDVHSKIQRYKRVLRSLIFACIPISYLLIFFPRFTGQATFSDILLFMVFLMALMVVFNIIRLALRVNKMEKGL